MDTTNNDPYKIPTADVELPVEKKALFSPLQIRTGAFLGGPITAIYLLKGNFDQLNDLPRAKKTLIFGLVFSGLLILSLPVLPLNFPRILIPLVYSFTAGYIAETFQRSKAAIAASPDLEFASNWKVAAASLGGLVIFCIVAFGYLFALDASGLVRLA